MVKQEAYKPKQQYKPQQKKKMFSPAILVAVFFGGIMVLSTVGFIGSYGGGSAGDLVYGDFTFTQTQGGYVVKVNDVSLEFSYFPQALESINISDTIVNTIKTPRAIVMTYNPESKINQSAGLIQYNYEQIFDKVLGAYAQRSVTNNTLFETLDEADCSDATQFVPVLMWEHGNKTAIYQEGFCVHAVAANDFEAIRLADRLAYRLIGVMES